MKILIPLLLLTLGANANEVVYGSKSGELTEQSETETNRSKSATVLELGEGEILEIVSVTGYAVELGEITNTALYVKTQHGSQLPTGFQEWSASPERASNVENKTSIAVGPCKVLIQGYKPGQIDSINWQLGYKLTKPSAAGTTTSAPILLPPTQDAAKSWFVKLQVSSDLKAWDDVAPGQFLGSDTARFFRIQTSEQ